MTGYPHQSHYPHTELNIPCRILKMRSAILWSEMYACLSHYFDLIRIQTHTVRNQTREAWTFYSFGQPLWSPRFRMTSAFPGECRPTAALLHTSATWRHLCTVPCHLPPLLAAVVILWRGSISKRHRASYLAFFSWPVPHSGSPTLAPLTVGGASR